MQILTDNKNLIIGYAEVGGFENGIEVANYPNDFIINFKPRYYLYNEGQIEVNKNYEEENGVFPPIESPSPNTPGTDEELRVMFATMQVQIVQANTMCNQVAHQNANLSQELVKLNKEIQDLKGVEDNENVIPEV